MAKTTGLTTLLGPNDKLVRDPNGEPVVQSSATALVFGDALASGSVIDAPGGPCIQWSVGPPASLTPPETANLATIEILDACKSIDFSIGLLKVSQWRRTGRLSDDEWRTFRQYLGSTDNTPPSSVRSAEYARNLLQFLQDLAASVRQCLQPHGGGEWREEGSSCRLIGWGIELQSDQVEFLHPGGSDPSPIPDIGPAPDRVELLPDSPTYSTIDEHPTPSPNPPNHIPPPQPPAAPPFPTNLRWVRSDQRLFLEWDCEAGSPSRTEVEWQQHGRARTIVPSEPAKATMLGADLRSAGSARVVFFTDDGRTTQARADYRPRWRWWRWLLLACLILLVVLVALNKCGGGPYVVTFPGPRPVLASEVLLRAAPATDDERKQPQLDDLSRVPNAASDFATPRAPVPRATTNPLSGGGAIPALSRADPAICQHLRGCAESVFAFCPHCGTPLLQDGVNLTPASGHDWDGESGSVGEGNAGKNHGSGDRMSDPGGVGSNGLGPPDDTSRGVPSKEDSNPGSSSAEASPGGTDPAGPSPTLGNARALEPGNEPIGPPEGQSHERAQAEESAEPRPQNDVGACDGAELSLRFLDAPLTRDGFAADSDPTARMLGISIRSDPARETDERQRQLSLQRVKPEDFRGYGLDPFRRGEASVNDGAYPWLDLRLDPPRLPNAEPLAFEQAGGATGGLLRTAKGTLQVEGALARLWIEPGIPRGPAGQPPPEWMFYPDKGDPHQPECWKLKEPMIEGGSWRLVCPPQLEPLEGFVEFMDPASAQVVARTLRFQLEPRR